MDPNHDVVCCSINRFLPPERFQPLGFEEKEENAIDLMAIELVKMLIDKDFVRVITTQESGGIKRIALKIWVTSPPIPRREAKND